MYATNVYDFSKIEFLFGFNNVDVYGGFGSSFLFCVCVLLFSSCIMTVEFLAASACCGPTTLVGCELDSVNNHKRTPVEDGVAYGVLCAEPR